MKYETISDIIGELEDWYLPEMDMKQAKKMAKFLRKVKVDIQTSLLQIQSHLVNYPNDELERDGAEANVEKINNIV